MDLNASLVANPKPIYKTVSSVTDGSVVLIILGQVKSPILLYNKKWFKF